MGERGGEREMGREREGERGRGMVRDLLSLLSLFCSRVDVWVNYMDHNYINHHSLHILNRILFFWY